MVALIAVSGIGCGGGESEGDKFNEDYKALNDGELLSLGQELGRSVSSAEDKSNSQLATEWSGLSDDSRELSAKLKELDPPEDLSDQLDRLTKSLDGVADELDRMAAGARADDPQAVSRATADLLDVSRDVNRAQNELAAETGADKGAS